MIKKHLLLLVLIMVLFPLSSLQVCVASNPVGLSGGYWDPHEPNSGEQRGPIITPDLEIEDYTLYFITPCYGYELRLLDENSNVVYTTIIPVNATSLVLPSCLSGDYEIQIIQGEYYFWGYIEL